MKLKFKKEEPESTPKVIMQSVRLHLLQESRLGISQQSGNPFYVLKFEMVTDLNGLQSVLGSVQSDGSLLMQVLDDKKEDNNES